MKKQILKIGGSKGIRIPTSLLNRIGVQNELEIEIHDNQIVIRPTRKGHKSWEEAFGAMLNHEEDDFPDELTDIRKTPRD